ncbi:MAG: hydrolase Nlp/P60 [Lachnospiraceae bacterium]|nr:hydrolase Nlp/P60 [Lachnospiraceae bacterium]
MRKRIFQMITTILLLVTICGQTIYATTSSEIQSEIDEKEEEMEQNQQELDEIEENIDALEDEQAEIEDEIEVLTTAIVEVMASIELLEGDIEVLEGDIEQAELDLADAIAKEEQQYADTMVRIQVMYEKNDNSYISMLMESKSLSDLFTRVEYIQQVYDYDNQMLEEYQQTKLEVAQLKEELEIEEAELEAAKEECELEKAELEAMVAELQVVSEEYEAQIADAQAQADTYAAQIREQNEAIRQLEQDRQEALEREEAEANPGGTGGTTTGGTNSSGGNKYTGSAYTIDTSIINNASGSDAGKQVALYAVQFLGNPYVMGGTSLTNGTDCSGFTQSVYKQFGVSIPRTSYSQRTVGTEVSYAEAQPGDIICYAGHVAIYVGGGLIVHASSAKTGIKISNATYRTIITVRRVL